MSGNMGQKHFCLLVVVLVALLISLGLTIVAILTDNWYEVETTGITNSTMKHQYNYNYGFWRRCYDQIPYTVPQDDRTGTDNNCVMIYEELIEKNEDDLSSDRQRHLHLKRSYVGLAITTAALQLATILLLLCGSWPGKGCDQMRKPFLYLSSSLVLLLATMAGIACGVCFIAAVDLEEKDIKDLPPFASGDYGWSFMLHWIGTGLSMVDAFILMCLLKFSYDEVNYDAKYFYSQEY